MGKPSREVVVKELTNIFEELGYTGAGMAQISAATQLGRGSLYNLFPDGKSQMMHEVLAAVEAEFHDAVIAPLEAGHIEGMFEGLLTFFRDGERPSLWGQLTLDEGGAAFHEAIRDHYMNWRGALTKAMLSAGAGRGSAASLSERTISGVEGALLLDVSLDDTGALGRGLRTMSVEISMVIPKNQSKAQPKAKATPKTKTAAPPKTATPPKTKTEAPPKTAPKTKTEASTKTASKTKTAANSKTPSPAKSKAAPKTRTA
ncbi:TetR family transcriptional regulator [Mobiluncus mulieris]|uniref:TetR family transcriptional regulator n=1 Tax=Mobiluncus mulieris TaxID=2052 RepID=UPI0021E2B058|nr:TetR family transcriptional regulator [Mobiluncus mulieris]MCV0012531.1 TetR family transcriptional regulator [Mobiluncus mulieris]